MVVELFASRPQVHLVASQAQIDVLRHLQVGLGALHVVARPVELALVGRRRRLRHDYQLADVRVAYVLWCARAKITLVKVVDLSNMILMFSELSAEREHADR